MPSPLTPDLGTPATTGSAIGGNRPRKSSAFTSRFWALPSVSSSLARPSEVIISTPSRSALSFLAPNPLIPSVSIVCLSNGNGKRCCCGVGVSRTSGAATGAAWGIAFGIGASAFVNRFPCIWFARRLGRLSTTGATAGSAATEAVTAGSFTIASSIFLANSAFFFFCSLALNGFFVWAISSSRWTYSCFIAATAGFSCTASGAASVGSGAGSGAAPAGAGVTGAGAVVALPPRRPSTTSINPWAMAPTPAP